MWTEASARLAAFDTALSGRRVGVDPVVATTDATPRERAADDDADTAQTSSLRIIAGPG